MSGNNIPVVRDHKAKGFCLKKNAKKNRSKLKRTFNLHSTNA